jgi:hypothetical protein
MGETQILQGVRRGGARGGGDCAARYTCACMRVVFACTLPPSLPPSSYFSYHHSVRMHAFMPEFADLLPDEVQFNVGAGAGGYIDHCAAGEVEKRITKIRDNAGILRVVDPCSGLSNLTPL